MKSRDIATYGLYIAIFLIFGLTPNLGYIKIGPIALTIMALPTTLIIVHKGWKGAIFGLFMFGVTSSITLIYLGAFFIAKLGIVKSLLTFFFARILIFIPLGLYLFAVRKIKINHYLHGFIIALIISIFNTLFVFSFYTIFGLANFVWWFIYLGITNILPEWLIIPVLGASLGKIGNIFKEKDKNIKFASYN